MAASELTRVLVSEIVHRALAEDLHGGDLTTEACIDPDAQSTAHAVARGDLVACGALVFAEVFAQIDPNVKVHAKVPDGTRVVPGQVLWVASGRSRSILMGERVALNL